MSDAGLRSGRRPRHRDSPRVRRLAREAGVDLATVPRSGAHGRATAADVTAARPPVPAGPRRSSQLLTVVEVDLTGLTGEARGLVLAFVAEASARAFRDAASGPVHLAVSSGPTATLVVRDSGDLSVGGLARRLADPSGGRDTAGREQGPENGATVRVVDAGDRDVLIGTSALPTGAGVVLTLGAVVRRPVVRQGADGQERLVFRSMAYLSLGHDPADLDEEVAARRLAHVRRRLEGWEPDAAAAAVADVRR